MLVQFTSVRVLLLFFGYLTRAVADQYESLHHDIRGARLPTTYHSYLARTMLYALGTFIGVLTLLGVAAMWYLRDGIPSVTAQIFVIGGVVLPALLLSLGVYQLRLYYPRYVANERARATELSMPTVVNFLFAMSRAGVPTGTVLELLADHVAVLGAAADEFRYAWRDIEYFGADVVSALRYLSQTTHLDELSEFIDGYLRALTGEGRAEEYLEARMSDLFEKAELEQEDFLSRLGVLAEVYVALFVAFPIFIMIILIVMGFIGAGGVLFGLRIIVYAVIPLAAIGFLVLLDTVMRQPLGGAGTHHGFTPNDFEDPTIDIATTHRDDPDEALHARRLERYRARQRYLKALGAPIAALRRDPRTALYLGAILGGLYLGVKLGLGIMYPENPLTPALSRGDGPLILLHVIDASIVEALMIVFVVYGVFYELRSRYLAAIEREIPGFLGELEQRHHLGMSLADGITALTNQDMGRMNEEIRRMSRDLRLQASIDDVLQRFANRVRSPKVTGVVVLLVAANKAAERLDPVLDALKRWSEHDQRLRNERRVGMLQYLIVIYVAYIVFVFILVILNNVFLPRVPTQTLDVGGLAGGTFDPVAFQTLFFHMSVIQAVFSGMVGGKMSEGRLSAGVKHALLMVLIAYVVFVVLLPGITIQV